MLAIEEQKNPIGNFCKALVDRISAICIGGIHGHLWDLSP